MVIVWMDRGHEPLSLSGILGWLFSGVHREGSDSALHSPLEEAVLQPKGYSDSSPRSVNVVHLYSNVFGGHKGEGRFALSRMDLLTVSHPGAGSEAQTRPYYWVREESSHLGQCGLFSEGR